MKADRIELQTLVEGLAQHHGYRSIWFDLHDRLCHSEPDDELEAYGFRYVTTLLRPDLETLERCLLSHLVPVLTPAPVRSVSVVLPDFAPA
jgi:hypothetical protein